MPKWYKWYISMFPQSHSAHKVLTSYNNAHSCMIESLGNNVSIIRQPRSDPMHYMWIDSQVPASQSQGYMLWMVYEWFQALSLGHPSRDPRHEEPHKGGVMTTMISLRGSYNTQSHPHVGCAFWVMTVPWWCHNMKRLSTLLTLFQKLWGNPPGHKCI